LKENPLLILLCVYQSERSLDAAKARPERANRRAFETVGFFAKAADTLAMAART
jgi:hypothetical protein